MSNEAVPQGRNQSNAAKTRNWCFTLNNPTEEERRFFAEMRALPRGLLFLILQEERGENGTVHFQGYLECATTHNINWLKNNFNPRAHFEVRRGTAQEAIAYCCKEDTRVPDGFSLRLGESRATTSAEAKQAKIDALDAIRKGELKLNDVPSEIMLNSGFLNAAKTVLSTMLGPRRNVRVITIIGGTGVGKSWACYQHCGSDLVVYQRGGWFAGAHTQGSNLLFDEFTGQVPLSDMLTYLHGFPNQLPVKGSFYPACYTTVFITSNVMPENWYLNDKEELRTKREGNLACLYRRIGYVGPQREYPEFENGCFIVIPELDERGRKIPIPEQRRQLHQRLLFLGIQVQTDEVPVQLPVSEQVPEQSPAQVVETHEDMDDQPLSEPPTQRLRPLDQLDDLFSNSLMG